MAATSQNVEKLILSLGGKGKFQLTILFLAAFTYTPILLNHVIMAFHGSPIPHTCMAGTVNAIGEFRFSFILQALSVSVSYLTWNLFTFFFVLTLRTLITVKPVKFFGDKYPNLLYTCMSVLSHHLTLTQQYNSLAGLVPHLPNQKAMI